MEIKFHCQGNHKNLAIAVFSPRHYILYFQIIISELVDYCCSVLYLGRNG